MRVYHYGFFLLCVQLHFTINHENIFALVVKTLTDRGLILKKGTIVDSAIIEALKQREAAGSECSLGEKGIRLAFWVQGTYWGR